MKKYQVAFRWLDAASSGSIITSGIFWLVYDQWKPLALAAVVVSILKIGTNAVTYIDNCGYDR